MPLIISRLPCYICKSDKEKPIPQSTRTERLTRCIGSAFLVKFYDEGITKDQDGREVLAHWVSDERTRLPLTGCNATDSGERYFHQSCLDREQAGPLSYDNKYYHYRGTNNEQYPVLRNITHKCCTECVAAAQDILQDEDKLKRMKYQNVIGRLQPTSYPPTSCWRDTWAMPFKLKFC